MYLETTKLESAQIISSGYSPGPRQACRQPGSFGRQRYVCGARQNPATPPASPQVSPEQSGPALYSARATRRSPPLAAKPLTGGYRAVREDLHSAYLKCVTECVTLSMTPKSDNKCAANE